MPAAHQSLLPLYSLVIPAYNEEQNVVQTIRELSRVLLRENIPHELIVVNDNSTDRTELVASLSGCSNVVVVNNELPRGFGRAVRYGLGKATGDVVALVMADLSDDPEDVVQCYRKLNEGYDCVFGSRFMHGSNVSNYPPLKLAINRIVNRALQVMFWTEINDLTNAFKVYRREVIENLPPLQAAHFNITIEISLSILIRGYNIVQIPVNWQGRSWGQSKLRLREMGRRYLCTLLKIWFERLLIRDDLLAESRKQPLREHEAGAVVADPAAESSVRI